MTLRCQQSDFSYTDRATTVEIPRSDYRKRKDFSFLFVFVFLLYILYLKSLKL